MHALFRGFLTVFCGLCWASCVAVSQQDTGMHDGEVCENDAQCASGVCTTDALCAHSPCECAGGSCSARGERSSECEIGWVCIASESLLEEVGELIDREPAVDDDGFCQIKCNQGCPEHYACAGDFCAPDRGWADPLPTVSWSGAAVGTLTGKDAMTTVPLQRGQNVMLTASAVSPANSAIASFTWTLVDESGQRTESSGATVILAIAPTGSFRRAELSVSDAKQRQSLISVIFEGCTGAGETCGYQGSGCCKSCDAVTNTCM